MRCLQTPTCLELVAIGILAVALQPAARGGPAQAQAPASAAAQDEATLNRIRAALAREPSIHVTPPEPTFRVTVREHPYYKEKPWTWDFDGGGVPLSAPQMGPPGSPALVTVDVLPWIRRAIRSRERHAAEDEVRRALAEFCATHACDPR